VRTRGGKGDPISVTRAHVCPNWEDHSTIYITVYIVVSIVQGMELKVKHIVHGRCWKCDAKYYELHVTWTPRPVHSRGVNWEGRRTGQRGADIGKWCRETHRVGQYIWRSIRSMRQSVAFHELHKLYLNQGYNSTHQWTGWRRCN